jgi:hypothetical protein
VYLCLVLHSPIASLRDFGNANYLNNYRRGKSRSHVHPSVHSHNVYQPLRSSATVGNYHVVLLEKFPNSPVLWPATARLDLVHPRKHLLWSFLYKEPEDWAHSGKMHGKRFISRDLLASLTVLRVVFGYGKYPYINELHTASGL